LVLAWPSIVTAQHIDIETLSRQAAVVVVATCQERPARWDSARQMIVTDYRFRVRQQVKGRVPDDIVVTEPGGQLPERNLALHVPHAARFEPGEEVLLFLSPDTTGMRVLGGSVGRYTVTLDPATGERQISKQSLSQVLGRVRDASRP